MGDYKNVSKFWQLWWKDVDGIRPDLGEGATLFANLRRLPGENHVEYNIVLTFGREPELKYPDHSNTRFCFRPLDINLTPTDWCLNNDMTGHHQLRIKAKGGGWWEGPFSGSAEWTKSKWGIGVLVFSLPETAMSKDGKQYFIMWEKPPVWVEGTRVIISGAYETRPLPPITSLMNRITYLVNRGETSYTP